MHARVTQVLSAVILVLGFAIVGVGIAREDAVRIVVGVLFAAVGAGRLWLARRGA